jgi:hypothetical protein
MVPQRLAFYLYLELVWCRSYPLTQVHRHMMRPATKIGDPPLAGRVLVTLELSHQSAKSMLQYHTLIDRLLLPF